MQADSRTLPRLLRAAARQHTDREAVVDGEVRLSFTDLHAEVRTAARALAALGVEPGDRVCLWAPNSWQWIVTALAVSYSGAALVPVNSRYTGHEAADIILRTRATAVVLADGFLGRAQYAELREAAARTTRVGGSPIDGLPEVRAVIRIPEPRAHGVHAEGVVEFATLPALAERVDPARVEARADAVAPEDVADVLFTSGTTGRGKGACSAHRQTLSVAANWGALAGITAEDRYLVVNPLFHSFGYKAGLVVCLLHGATAFPQAVFTATETLRLISRERITVLPGAPPIYQALLDSPEHSEFDTSSLRLAVTGAALVPVPLVERMRTDLGFDTVLTAYGLTEAVVTTMCRPGDPDDLVARSTGRAVPGVELRINDESSDSTGEVLVRGEHVMLGYLDDPDATAEAIDEHGWLHTGDVGWLDADGYLTITGRLKDMYVVGGFNVYPAEVEQVLAGMDGLLEAAVVGVEDDRLGEIGRAFAVRAGNGAVTAESVLSHCAEHLANFKVPREVVFLDALPRNSAGKVLKRRLRGTPSPGQSHEKELP